MRRLALSGLLLCTSAAVAIASPAKSQLRRTVSTQVLEVQGEHRSFGISLEVEGDTLVVGDASYDAAGGAFVYRRGASGRWKQRQVLTAADRVNNDQYGSRVALHHDALVVGEWLDDDQRRDGGAVFIFRRRRGGAFREAQKIHPPKDGALHHFGIDFDLSAGVLAVVGDLGTPSGERKALYIYGPSATGWVLRQTVVPDPETDKQYGLSVAVCDDLIVAGMNHSDAAGNDSGAAFLLARGANDSWSVVQRLLPTDLGPQHHFGTRVDTDCQTVAISTSMGSGGAVYLYRPDGEKRWQQVAKVQAPIKGRKDSFGVAVAIRGSDLVVGAQSDADAGVAHLYRNVPGSSAWFHVTTLEAAKPPTQAHLGGAVGRTNDQIFVSAMGAEPDSVHVFNVAAAASRAR